MGVRRGGRLVWRAGSGGVGCGGWGVGGGGGGGGWGGGGGGRGGVRIFLQGRIWRSLSCYRAEHLNILWSENIINVRGFFEKIVPFLLGDTPCNCDLDIRPYLLIRFQSPKFTVKFLLCLLPDTARVEYDQISRMRTFSPLVSALE